MAMKSTRLATLFPINEASAHEELNRNMTKISSKTQAPTPQILQRAAKVVLSGKCPLSKPIYAKLKRHRQIMRKLAAMKGNVKSKKAFVTRNKKQVGGFISLLPMIVGAVGSILPNLLKGFSR